MGKRTALVIDDEIAIRELLRDILTQLNCDVCAVAGLEEARLAIVALDAAPDVAFVDVNLEHRDGLDAVRALRRIPRLAGTVFVAISGDVVLDQQQVEAAGCAGFLAKPFSLAEITAYLPA